MDQKPPEVKEQDTEYVEQMANLVSIGRGAALEKFDGELRKVLENIKDQNTEAEDVRKITLTVTFRPDKDREKVSIDISARSNLPAMKPTGDWIFLGKKNGQLVGTVMHPEMDPRQGVLPLSGKKVGDGGQ